VTRPALAPGWRMGQLQDLVFFQRGFDITQAQQRPGQYPVISSSGVTSYHDECMVQGPGVIIGRKGTLGSIHYCEGDYWPHDTTLWSKDLRGNNPKFVYLYLHTVDFKRFDVGNSNPTLNRNHIHDLPARIPPPKVQERIANILGAYDDLIENNRRRMALLEEAARQLYREWFVRLRFPGHEHTRITNGVPEAWEKIHLSDAVDTQYGYTETATDEPVGPKFLRGTDINKSPFIDWSTVPHCPIDETLQRKYQLRVGDIVIIRMADPGKVAIVERDIDAVFASYLIRLLPTDPRLRPYYLFYVLSDDAYQGFISGVSTGSTRKTASAPLLVDFHLLLPPQTLLRAFEDSVRPLRQQITTLLIQNEKLRAARDLLLPRLMSGEIAV
jgi:type I restriction enzyme, S subunit